MALLLTLLALVGVTARRCVDHPVQDLLPQHAVDGDTVVDAGGPARVARGDPGPLSCEACALPDPLPRTLRLRILGVDCPETHAPRCEGERQAGLAAHRFTEAQLADPPDRVRLCGWDKYGGQGIDCSVGGGHFSHPDRKRG